MTSRANMKKALHTVVEGLSRARANNFGAQETLSEHRKRKKAVVHATKTLERRSCGARRRRDGKPCNALNVPGSDRCKWHGGKSTGPKTAEGKARSLANLRQYRDQQPNEQGA